MTTAILTVALLTTATAPVETKLQLTAQIAAIVFLSFALQFTIWY